MTSDNGDVDWCEVIGHDWAPSNRCRYCDHTRPALIDRTTAPIGLVGDAGPRCQGYRPPQGASTLSPSLERQLLGREGVVPVRWSEGPRTGTPFRRLAGWAAAGAVAGVAVNRSLELAGAGRVWTVAAAWLIASVCAGVMFHIAKAADRIGDRP